MFNNETAKQVIAELAADEISNANNAYLRSAITYTPYGARYTRLVCWWADATAEEISSLGSVLGLHRVPYSVHLSAALVADAKQVQHWIATNNEEYDGA